MIPPRQASSQRLLMSSPPPDSVHSDSDRNSGQNQHQQQQRGPPERPDRPDRRTTQRPTSPPMFSPSDRKGSFSNPTISQHTNQLMNSQMGQHPMTSFASPPPPPPRGISAGAGFSPANSANVGPNDYQAEGLSVATRRQTLRDDFQGGYGGAVIGTASPINSPIASRRAIHPIPSSPSMGASPSPLRVINVSPTSPPPSSRSFSDIGADDTTSPISARPNKDHHSMDFVPPPGTGKGPVEDINPYAMEAITPGSTMSPMVQSPSSTASPSAYIPPPPLMTSFSAAVSGSEGQNIIANSSPRSPLSGVNSHLPPSTSAVPGSDRKPGQPAQASTPIPGPLNDRSASPIAGKNMTTRGSGGSAFALGLGTDGSSTPVVTSVPEKSARRVSVQQQQQQQEVMKMSRVVQSENEMLKQEVEKLRKREQWLMAEVILTRDSLPAPTSGHGKKQEGNDDPSSLSLQEKRLSMVDLERELASGELEGQQLKIMKALVKVKEELKTAKMSIVTQAQTASNKIKEAERVRTAALQEAAYLKAKMSSMTNAQQDPGALARVEMERAADLEKRLTNALNELDAMEIQYQKAQETLEQEKRSRIAAEERSQGSILLADQAQSAHTRALAEITSLHSRASKAEAESREYAAQLAETQAGVSGHQSQSSGLLQKVQSLKQQVEEQELALERAQVAFSVANDRAARAEARSEEAAQKIDRLESQRFELSTEANRYKSEAERLQSKVEDLENRWQVSKDEVATLRKLVEDGLGAFSPRARSEKITPERKHDSIAILSTVSRVSELEHELASLKKLHSVSQAAATKSSSELADAMIELSRLEQASMQARTETISLQKLLSHEREAAAQLRSNLVKTEQQLEEKVKELEDHEVQLGLLQDVMREKGMIAEDIVVHARARGTPEYAIELEGKVRAAQERIEELEQELKEVRSRFNEQSVVLENQRQNANQQAEKMSILLRKIKKDLEETIKEKEEVEIVFKQLQEDHAHCDDHVQELSTSCENLKEQEEERMMMLKMHWEEEHQELSGQINDLQKKLEESEMQSSELSQKAISATERLQEVEALNEAISDELENLQGQMESMKKKAAKTEEQLKADVERLVTEIHQTQEKLHAKQSEFNEASELNEQLQRELEQALQAQNQSQNTNQGSTAAIQRLESERQDLEQRLKKAQEEIHILEGDNSVLEARLADAEKKVALLLEDMQSSMTDVSNSPPSSDNLAGIHQQLTNHLRLNLSNLNSQTTSGSASSSPSILKNQHHQQSSPVLTNAQRLINNARSASQGSRSSQGSHSNSPVSQNATTTLSPLGSPTSKIYHATKTILNRTKYSNQNSTIGTIGTIGKQQTPHVGEYDAGEHVKPSEHQQRDLDRDSVDSITRELEMLKVPWNKNTPAFMQQQQQQQQQQQVPQTYQYSGKLNDHKNQFYNYSDESSEGDNEEEYLAHMKQQQEQQQQHFKDTRSFNEKSTLRLKEYEQMIDEIENSRLH
ncbi:Negative regulator of mitotic exit [Lobosporangium transversale]|nr:Negative regulator of mitotic exit [Lobosporangium transversale]